jgi:hypothetical protein
VIDTTDPKLKRAGYIVIAYAIIDLLTSWVLSALCINCTVERLAMRLGVAAGAFAFDIAIVAGAYYGMRGRTGGFITALVILCIRSTFALVTQNFFLICYNLFFAYWAYVGTATCIINDRSEAAYNALRKLPPVDPEPPPPPPWLPPKTGTWPPR